MKRLYLLLFALFLASIASAQAQISSSTARQVVATVSAPTTCSYNSAADPVIVYNGVLYVCSITNVYVATGTGGGPVNFTPAAGITLTPNPLTLTGTIGLAAAGTACPNGSVQIGFDSTGAIMCVPQSSPTPQYIGPQAFSGCGVEWTGLLNFTVGACVYTIPGVTPNPSTPNTNLTLAPADSTFDRIELIYINGVTNTVTFDPGTPAANPAVPVEDPSTTIALTSVYVAANSTLPNSITKYDIYHTDSSDWACTTGGTNANRINCTSTNNPYDTTQTIEYGSGGTVNTTGYAQLQYASTLDVSQSDNMILYIRNKAAWPSTRSLTIQFYSTGSAKGNAVILSNGAFGFNATTNTSTYQQIIIPTILFAAAGIQVNQLRVIVSGTGAALTGFYLDDITLQGGLLQPVLPNNLMSWRGTYSPLNNYKPNDVVVSQGVGYVALIANTNVALTTASTWAQLGPVPGYVARQISGSSGTVLAGDNTRGIVNTSATAVAMTLPTPAALGIANFAFNAVAAGAGVVTYTPDGSLPVYGNGNSANSSSTLVVTPGMNCRVSMDASGAAWDSFCGPKNGGMSFVPTVWSSGTSYVANDVVVYNGQSFIALLANSNSAPTTANSNWSRLGGPLVATSPTNGNCVQWSVSGGVIQLADTGGVCGGTPGGGIIGYSSLTTTLAAATYYFPVVGGGPPSSTEANVDTEAPSGATVTNLYVSMSAAIGAGNTAVFTYRNNTADTSLTCTLSGTGAGGTTCHDTTHSFAVAAGDLMTIKVVTTGTVIVTPTLIMTAQFGTTGSNGTVNTGTTGQVAYYAVGGTALSGHTTGNGVIQKGSTSTGLADAVAADVVSLFSTCSGTQYLGADGACHSASAATAVVRRPMYCRAPQSSAGFGNVFPTVTALSNGLDWQHWEFVNLAASSGGNTDGKLFCSIVVSHNIDATPSATIIARFAATTTATANVRLQEGDFIVGASASYNGSFTTTTAQTVAIAAQWTNFNVTFTPNATIAADGVLWVEIIRVDTNVADTYAANLALDGVEVQWTEDF